MNTMNCSISRHIFKGVLELIFVVLILFIIIVFTDIKCAICECENGGVSTVPEIVVYPPNWVPPTQLISPIGGPSVYCDTWYHETIVYILHYEMLKEAVVEADGWNRAYWVVTGPPAWWIRGTACDGIPDPWATMDVLHVYPRHAYVQSTITIAK